MIYIILELLLCKILGFRGMRTLSFHYARTRSRQQLFPSFGLNSASISQVKNIHEV
jgi:hypothetical protein